MAMSAQAQYLRALLGATALIVVMIAADSAQAGGFAIREQSATGQGASFAGIAAGGGGSISGMFWNPAVVTQGSGLQSESHLSVIIPQSDVTIDPARSTIPGSTVVPLTALGATLGPTSGDIGQGALVPASYGSYRVNDSLYLGYSVNAPFGLVTDPPSGWAARFHAQTSDLMTINAAPTIGYKINDMLSVAAGVQINYIDARLTSAGTGGSTVIVEGDDWGFGGTIGATFTPMEGTSIGLGYRSRIKHTLEGTAKSHALSGAVTSLGGGITGDITLPDTVTLGVRHDLTPEWTVLGGVEWSNWSTFETLQINLNSGGALSTVPENWDDGWMFSLGLEYKWDDALTLRAGGAYEISPVPDQFRTTRIPDADRIWASVGASYRFNDWASIDVGYTHIFVDDAPINLTDPLDVSRGYLFGDADGSVDIVGVSLRFNWGGSSAPKLF